MVVQTFTMNQFLIYVNELPYKIEKGVNEINLEMAKSLQRRVRFRAPRGSTGSLKNVQIENKGKNLVLTGPEHWFFVNAGMAPDRYIPVELFEAHQGSPGSTAGKHTFIENPRAWVFAGFHGGKGFVDNSISALQQDIIPITERGLNIAFQK